MIRADMLFDAGKSINPGIDIGQVEGCFLQGLGYYLFEDIIRTPSGAIITKNPANYKVPTCRDSPIILHASLYDNPPPSPAVFSSRGIGEPPLTMAVSAFSAVRHAIAAARGDGKFVALYSPAVPEMVLDKLII